MGTCHELNTCNLFWFLKTNLRSVPCEIIQLYAIRLKKLIPKIALVPRQVPTGTTDTTRTVTESQCCASTRMHAPVYPAVKCISVLLSDMSLLSGGWFLHSIGISILHVNLRFVRKIQTEYKRPLCLALYSVFPVQNEGCMACIVYNDNISYLPSYLDILLNLLCFINADMLVSIR